MSCQNCEHLTYEYTQFIKRIEKIMKYLENRKSKHILVSVILNKLDKEVNNF